MLQVQNPQHRQQVQREAPKKSRSPHKFVPEGEKMTARFGALLKHIS